MLRDFVIALSLSNLWFLGIWRLFLIPHPTYYPYYHWKSSPSPIMLAAVLDVLLLAMILWLGTTLVRRLQKPMLLEVTREIFLVIFFLTMSNLLGFIILSDALRRFMRSLSRQFVTAFPSIGIDTLHNGLWILGGLLTLILATVLIHRLIFRRRQVVRVAVGVLLIFAPFVAITFSQATWQWAKFRSGEQFRDVAAPVVTEKRNSNRRVLWVIFDEFDYRLAFANRPSTVKLPEFDRLRNESVFATHAYPPSGDTVLSLPALTTGKLVSKSIRTGPAELMLNFGDSPHTVSWNTEPNIFAKARDLGLNTGLAGSYHPYCRVLGSNLTKCSWETIPFLPDEEISQLASRAESLSVIAIMQKLLGKASIPMVVRPFVNQIDSAAWRKLFFDGFQNIHSSGLAMATDPNFQLIMIHYPIPHPPGVYDRYNGNFALDASRGYLDNLALADRVLGELRLKMEEAGLWNNTTLVVSSDHRLRIDRVWRNHPVLKPYFTKEDPSVLNSVKDERVPFILKIGAEAKSLNYESAFNTVLSHDLLLAYLNGQISNSDEVVKWLDEHRSIGESPYLEGDK